MSKRARRQFTTEQKADVLRRNMIEKVPVSELCNELSIQPSLFYTWQRQAFDNLPAALNGPASTGPSRREKELDRKSTPLNSSHANSSYPVLCMKQKTN